MRDVAGLDAWLAKGIFSRLPASVGSADSPQIGVQAAAFPARSAVYRQIPVVMKATQFR